jgi:predicted unusual protein kinase regulating ubiquinone biosynthesis (AarF/ABC1/UbiB family)
MNLLLFLLNIVKYKISFDKQKSIIDIKNMLSESGPIWQKFGQILSYQEELIGNELAIELQSLLVNCPVHDHEYSKKINQHRRKY